MTNEEAIEELKEEMEVFKENIDSKALKNPDAELKKVLEANDLAIKALELAMWIPCSERLPEEDGFYLATFDGEICGEDKPFSGLAEFENGKWVDDEEDYQCVIAWMPLPQPYKAESEDKE